MNTLSRWFRRLKNRDTKKSKAPWRSEDYLEKLEAWAMSKGYDPLAKPVQEPLPPGYLSKDFTEDEFKCHGHGCYPAQGMDQKLIDSLQILRDHYGVPITINSGYRCPEYNEEVGGAPDSQHVHATAADIVVSGVSPDDVYALLNPTWAGGLGKYETFTHLDTRAGKARW